jgi:hypothetical protein
MKHRTTLLPLEVWEYSSPRLIPARKRVDLGELAEAFLYYDRVLVIAKVEQIEDMVHWFTNRTSYLN